MRLLKEKEPKETSPLAPHLFTQLLRSKHQPPNPTLQLPDYHYRKICRSELVVVITATMVVMVSGS